MINCCARYVYDNSDGNECIAGPKMKEFPFFSKQDFDGVSEVAQLQ